MAIQSIAEDIADAYEAVAQANHYLVGVLARDGISNEEYGAAEQVLINRLNKESDRTGRKTIRWRRLNLALDTLEYDRKRMTSIAAGRMLA